MRLSKMLRVHREQSGFTLIEILITVVISGLIVGAIASVIFEIYDGHTRSTAHMTAITEIENSVHWITPDAQMAQNVTAGVPHGFPITLNWVEWNGTAVSVTYSIKDGQLQRSYSENGGTPTIAIVARHIDSAQTSCTVNGAMITFKLTSAIGTFRPETSSSLFTILFRCAS